MSSKINTVFARFLTSRARFGPFEFAFWLAAFATIYLLPGRHLILTETAIWGLFTLSLDLILGYAGIISLGHAAFFGVGAYAAGLLAKHEIIVEPSIALVCAGLLAAALGFATSFLVLRGSDLTRLMASLRVALHAFDRALGRRVADPHHRRRRLSLWRPHRRSDLPAAAGLSLRPHGALLAVLDRLAARRHRDRREGAYRGVGPFCRKAGCARSSPARPGGPGHVTMAGASPTPVLETRNLDKRFGGIVAASAISIAIRKGARHALIGPNAARKTTFVNLLTGVLRPSGGEILLDGAPITNLEPHRRVRLGIARTFQINQLFADLTPIETLGLAVSERHGSGRDWWPIVGSRAGITAEAAELWERFRLVGVTTDRTAHLPSTKQRRRAST